MKNHTISIISPSKFACGIILRWLNFHYMPCPATIRRIGDFNKLFVAGKAMEIKMKNEFKLTIDSKSVNEGFARIVVSAFVTPLDPTIDELADLKTAVSEAVTNSIVHGYKDKFGKIYITGKLIENTVKIVIKDKGCGIDDINQAMTPLYTTGEGERAGLGFTVMESFCDKITVRSTVGLGTTVTLTKKIEGKSKW